MPFIPGLESPVFSGIFYKIYIKSIPVYIKF